LQQAAVEHGIDLRRSFLVGDRWRDIEAGQRAGCRTIFIDRGYREPRPMGADAVVDDLAEAASWIGLSKREVFRWTPRTSE
jgi:D-glycero-D-manno-heptose 1,7-bisphosphate phosphatase